jgi:hypothetical protein
LRAHIDLLGCEYLGGCPTIGDKVLSKVEMHFTDAGLNVAIAPQGLFTLATAHPVLALTWTEINVLSMKQAHSGPPSATPLRALRSAVNVLTMRLDLPYQLTVETPTWTMNIGVRIAPDELAAQLHELLAGYDGPKPRVATV